MSGSGRVIGIDLGTTNSCVAILDGNEVVVIPNSEGSRTTPSVVGFTETGERLVGQIAKRQAITNPENTVYEIKRMMGRKFDDPEVVRHRGNVLFKTLGARNGDAWVEVRGKEYSPAEISAMVLEKMKKTAEDYLGEDVKEAVITVPAYFDDTQRQATKDAGRIAGLEVLRIINEPTAAALAYGSETKTDEKIAVYDLGGGTFDISLLQLQQGVFQVRAVNGDGFLGGADFDQRIVDYLADAFSKENGIDIRKDRMALQRLKEAAEKAKHELSSSIETEVNLPFIAADASGPKHLVTMLTRAKLESLTQDLIDRTIPPCEMALKDAGWTMDDINTVIMVGGQTRMPRVQEKVNEFFGKKGSRTVNPDEVVAVGAAIQGSVLKGETQDVLLLDVTPLSLGVETAGGVFTPSSPRNTTIPVRRAEIFSTAVDNQPYVNVHVLQGERPMSADNKSLAHFQLVGIPPAPRGAPQIEVAFDIDSNGIVHVSAKNLQTGKEQSVRVKPTSGLSEAQINDILTEAEKTHEEDARKREVAELRNRAETLIYSTERALEEYGGQLESKGREDVRRELEVTRDAAAGEDPEVLRAAVAKLEDTAYRLFETLQSAG